MPQDDNGDGNGDEIIIINSKSNNSSVTMVIASLLYSQDRNNIIFGIQSLFVQNAVFIFDSSDVDI